MVTGNPLFRIQRHLLEEAFTVGCRWQQVGRFGALVNPRLADPHLNHVRLLGRDPLDLQTDRASLVRACDLLAELGRPLVVVFDPAEAPVMLPALLSDERFVLEAREVIMVLAADDGGSPPAPDITIVPVGVGPLLRDYTHLWGRIFDQDDIMTWLAALEASLRVEIATGTAQFICALRAGHPVGIGAVRGRRGVAELVGIGTLVEARGRGVATAIVRHLVRLARARRAELIFLVVTPGSPAERLYYRLGFRVVGEQQRWRCP